MENRIQKHRKNTILLLLFVTIFTGTFGQKRTIIKNSYSFFTEQLPGNIKVDTNGRPYPPHIDTTFIIYVETCTKNIKWETIYINGVSCSIANELIVSTPFSAGRLNNNNKIEIRVEKNNFLWQLYVDLLPRQKDNNVLPEYPGLWIKGKYKGKLFFKKIADPLQIASIPSV